MKTRGLFSRMLTNCNFKLPHGICGVILTIVIGQGMVVAAPKPPSFTFSATVPTTVEPGVTFFVPATITDTGGQAIDYHSFFQIYDSNFDYLSQTYYDDQTFLPHHTLDYDVPLTAPTTPGYYWVAGLVFDRDYTGPIVADQFFLPTFTVAAAPEPGYGLPFGLFMLATLGIAAARKKKLKVGTP